MAAVRPASDPTAALLAAIRRIQDGLDADPPALSFPPVAVAVHPAPGIVARIGRANLRDAFLVTLHAGIWHGACGAFRSATAGEIAQRDELGLSQLPAGGELLRAGPRSAAACFAGTVGLSEPRLFGERALLGRVAEARFAALVERLRAHFDLPVRARDARGESGVVACVAGEVDAALGEALAGRACDTVVAGRFTAAALRPLAGRNLLAVGRYHSETGAPAALAALLDEAGYAARFFDDPDARAGAQAELARGAS